MAANSLVSIVIPVFNEESNIKPLLGELKNALKPYSHEIIFVDDGSTDKTAEIIKTEAAKSKTVKLITFQRNFGHQMALSAGYAHSSGDCVITLDADLQDPPEIIPSMIKKWQEGAKIVFAKREKREADDSFKKLTAHLFYKYINFLSDTPIPREVGDFRLIDKSVVRFLNALPERSLFLRGLTAWGGFSTEYVHFKRGKRYAGETHYTFSKMINFALEGITSFSTKPLRLAIYLGFATSAFSILVIFIKTLQRFVLNQGDWLPGWASLFFSIVFLGGVQLMTIGIIGEYVGKIYQEVQQRPKYLIREKVNI